MLTRLHILPVLLALCWPIAQTIYAAAPTKLSDEELRKKISGVWYFEIVPSLKQHIAQRTQYFLDGKVVSDYRISGPGNEKYLRALGTWKVEEGQFSETTSETSDPAIKFPAMVRKVIAIDGKHILLETPNGTRAELWRGEGPLEEGELKVSSLDEKMLVKDLRGMHMSGWHSVPAGDGNFSFQLDSRVIQEAPKKKTTK